MILTQIGAGEGNRTLVVSLEGFCSTIELHPQSQAIQPTCPTDNNFTPQATLNLVEGEGFEPSKAEPSDLQSDPFGRSGTPPSETANYEYFTAISQSDSNTVL